MSPGHMSPCTKASRASCGRTDDTQTPPQHLPRPREPRPGPACSRPPSPLAVPQPPASTWRLFNCGHYLLAVGLATLKPPGSLHTSAASLPHTASPPRSTRRDPGSPHSLAHPVPPPITGAGDGLPTGEGQLLKGGLRGQTPGAMKPPHKNLPWPLPDPAGSLMVLEPGCPP